MEESPSGVTWMHYGDESMLIRRLEEQVDISEQMLAHMIARGSSLVLTSYSDNLSKSDSLASRRLSWDCKEKPPSSSYLLNSSRVLR